MHLTVRQTADKNATSLIVCSGGWVGKGEEEEGEEEEGGGGGGRVFHKLQDADVCHVFLFSPFRVLFALLFA